MNKATRLMPFAAVILLAACNQSGQQAAAPAATPAVQSNVTPSSFRMPEGAGCTGSVNRYRAIMDNDLATGHVNKTVYDRIIADINAAAQQCASGNDQGARAAIASIRSRNGYPADRS